MPSREELPDGPRREFVTELRRYYRAADRPAYRKVSQAIEKHPDFQEITASQETVRRVCRGMVLPLEVARVRAIFYVFCEMAGIDPNSDWSDDSYDRYGEAETKWERIRRLWDVALEEEADAPSLPQPTPPAAPAQPAPPRRADPDPWSSSPAPWASSSSHSDEPPF
jgi:hypothetical protein